MTMADRISMLPDEIVCHILSFLPTQDVVATSLLSKRWKPLWRLVPSLYFDDKSYLTDNEPYDLFEKFIFISIIARDADQPIKSFRLQCWSPRFNLSESDLNIWVYNAMQRGLENLHIQLPSMVSLLYLRGCIFTSKTLVVLKLVGLDVDAFPVDLPSLKTIFLYDVFFPEQKHVMELFSGCPILETMQLVNIGYKDSSTSCNKKVKTLSKLVGADIRDIDFDTPLKAICNVEFLRIDKCPDGIPVFSNLTHLEIRFGSNMNWHLVLSIIEKSPKLQTIVLNMETSAAHVVWTSPSLVSKCLSSQLRICCITNFEGKESELHFVKYIMKNSGVLHRMTICTKPSLRLECKFERLQELSLCPRSSTNCELSFK